MANQMNPIISTPMAALSRYMSVALKRRLPPDVVEKGKHLILDTLAAMVSGSRLPPGKIAISYVRTLGGKPEACVAGTRLLTSVANAALANGMLGHTDETDDSHAPSHTHPGCGVIPAALAIAERHARDGRSFLRAVVLGYDVCCRSTQALGATKSWHKGLSTHGMGGTFGAAAAAGTLLGLKARELRYMLSYAAQQASGMSCLVRDVDHIEKAFDIGGMPAHQGVLAATMAAHGFTGLDDVFSGERNFISTYAIDPDPDELALDLGKRFEIMNTNVKKWCVGSPIQAGLDSLSALMKEHRITGADVAKLVVRVDPRGAAIVNNRPMPDINMQHMLAVMLLDGTASFQAAHDVKRMKHPRVLAMKQHIELTAMPELTDARPRRQGIVEITTHDGRTLAHRTYAVRGTADNPMPRQEVEDKARDLLAPVLGAKRTQALIDAIWNIERLRNVRELRALLRA